MYKFSKSILVIIALLCFPGCLTQNVKFDGIKLPNFHNVVTPVNDIKDERGFAPKVTLALKNSSKEDCLYIAKFYFGLSEYLQHSKSIQNTSQLAPPNGLVVHVHNEYGWTMDKNKELGDLLEKDMDEYLELKKPKVIDDNLRKKFVETFKVYGEGAYRASLNK